MRTLKWALLPLLLVAAASVSWYYFTYPLEIVSPAANSTGHTYNITPPTMFPQTQGQTGQAGFMLFINFDDGRYALTEAKTPSASTTYSYRATGNYAPYSESTEIYTDKKPPPSVARMGVGEPSVLDPYLPLPTIQNLSVNNGEVSSLDPFKITMSKPIQIEATRRVVPESGLTYAVAVENLRKGNASCGAMNAVLKLNYDADVLDYLNSRDGSAQITHTNNNSVTNGKGTVTINLSGMAESEQRSLIFLFKTRAGVTTSTPIDELTNASVEFSSASPNIDPACLGPFRDTIKGQNRVFDSHDPNHKLIIPDAFCNNESKDLLFRVDFQNDGLAPTQNIGIEDELDYLYADNIPASSIKEVEAYIGGVFHSSPTLIMSGRKFRCQLQNAKLNGTHQPGYGIKFSDASTRGYLEFKIHTDKLTAKPSCSAVCNLAKIFFDCNPPIETNTALSGINCDDCSLCTQRDLYSSENGIIKSGDETPILHSSVRNLLEGDLGLNFICKWYPASAVSDPTSPNAYCKALTKTNFTLIATSSDTTKHCQRRVYHRTYIVPCNNLQVTATATPTFNSGCPENWKYTIDATATGNVDPNDLIWAFGSNCNTNAGLHWTKTNVSPGIYKVVVTDSKTGCTAEAEVNIQAIPIVVDDDPSDCMVSLMISGGTPPYSCQWQWNGQMQAQTGTTLNDLNNKTNVVVTVTDANGCKKVFRPRGSCPPPPLPTWTLISFLGLGLTGLAYWLYKKKVPG